MKNQFTSEVEVASFTPLPTVQEGCRRLLVLGQFVLSLGSTGKVTTSPLNPQNVLSTSGLIPEWLTTVPGFTLAWNRANR